MCLTSIHLYFVNECTIQSNSYSHLKTYNIEETPFIAGHCFMSCCTSNEAALFYMNRNRQRIVGTDCWYLAYLSRTDKRSGDWRHWYRTLRFDIELCHTCVRWSTSLASFLVASGTVRWAIISKASWTDQGEGLTFRHSMDCWKKQCCCLVVARANSQLMFLFDTPSHVGCDDGMLMFAAVCFQ